MTVNTLNNQKHFAENNTLVLEESRSTAFPTNVSFMKRKPINKRHVQNTDLFTLFKC